MVDPTLMIDATALVRSFGSSSSSAESEIARFWMTISLLVESFLDADSFFALGFAGADTVGWSVRRGVNWSLVCVFSIFFTGMNNLVSSNSHSELSVARFVSGFDGESSSLSLASSQRSTAISTPLKFT